LAAFFFAGAFFLALLVPFFLMAIPYLLLGFRSGSRCVWTTNAPRREPPATVHRNPTAAL
jgi:hypothetical protein